MKELQGGYSGSRASRTVDRYMIAICVLFIFALCSTSYSAAAQNPNLLDQMEQDFNDLSEKAISWSDVSESNTDNIALVEKIGLRSESAEWVEVLDYGIIEFEEFYLPLPADGCMTWRDVQCTWYIKVNVTGGYHHKMNDFSLTLVDKDGVEYTFGVYEWYHTEFACQNKDEYEFC